MSTSFKHADLFSDHFNSYEAEHMNIWLIWIDFISSIITTKVLNGHSAARLNSPYTELEDCPDVVWVSRSYPSQSNLLVDTNIEHFIPSHHQSFVEINITLTLLSLHDKNKCFTTKISPILFYWTLVSAFVCLNRPWSRKYWCVCGVKWVSD